MRTFDETGKEFLGNYVGSDYASVLSLLRPRQSVIFGKSGSCENPVLVRLNDNEDFRAAFRPINPPRTPAPYVPPSQQGAAPVAAGRAEEWIGAVEADVPDAAVHAGEAEVTDAAVDTGEAEAPDDQGAS